MTERGRAVIDEAVVAGLDVQREMLAVLGPERTETLSGLLCVLLGECV